MLDKNLKLLLLFASFILESSTLSVCFFFLKTDKQKISPTIKKTQTNTLITIPATSPPFNLALCTGAITPQDEKFSRTKPLVSLFKLSRLKQTSHPDTQSEQHSSQLKDPQHGISQRNTSTILYDCLFLGKNEQYHCVTINVIIFENWSNSTTDSTTDFICYKLVAFVWNLIGR